MQYARVTFGAIFGADQPAVSFATESEGTRVFICLNRKIEQIEGIDVIQYDYAEYLDADPDRAAIEADPAKYFDLALRKSAGEPVDKDLTIQDVITILTGGQLHER